MGSNFERVFIDETVINLINFLDGPSRQNLARTNTQLYQVIKCEHIRLMKKEFKRLIEIISDVDAPFAEKFKNDAFDLLNKHNDDNVDDIFAVLFGAIKVVKFCKTIQVILFFVQKSPKHENLYAKISLIMFKTASISAHTKDDSSFFCEVLRHICSGFKMKKVSKASKMIKLLNYLPKSISLLAIQRYEKMREIQSHPLSVFLVLTNVLLKNHSYHFSPNVHKTLSNRYQTYCCCQKEIVLYDQKQLDEHLQYYDKIYLKGDYVRKKFIVGVQTKITQSVIDQLKDCEESRVLSLFDDWFNFGCNNFFSLSEFCYKSYHIIKNGTIKSNKPIILSMPLSLILKKVDILWNGKMISYFLQSERIKHIEKIFFSYNEDSFRFYEHKLIQFISYTDGEFEHFVELMNLPLMDEFFDLFKFSELSILDIEMKTALTKQKILSLINFYPVYSFFQRHLIHGGDLYLMEKFVNFTQSQLDKLQSIVNDYYCNKVSHDDVSNCFNQLILESDIYQSTIKDHYFNKIGSSSVSDDEF